MVARVCVYLLILATLDIPFCLEQPASSLLEWHPLFAFLARNFTIYKVICLQHQHESAVCHLSVFLTIPSVTVMGATPDRCPGVGVGLEGEGL